jgi:hypothetical protein
LNLHNSSILSCKSENEKYLNDLKRNIDSITKSLSKPYFNKILKNLLEASPHNTITIYDYIITEQTELTLKIQQKKARLKFLYGFQDFMKINLLKRC